MKKKKEPFHIVVIKRHGKHGGYDIYLNDTPFLMQSYQISVDKKTRLKRHEAYAIARLLNRQRPDLKWADKFDDPYV